MSWDNKKGKCFYSYYIMFIHPTREGKALVSTCSNNFFRYENRVIVDADISAAWNAPQFRFQRSLLLKGSWQACWGAECAYRPTTFDDHYIADPEVKEHIRSGKTRLAYLPKALYLVPTMVCNQSCYYCYCFRGKRHKHCRTAQLREGLLREIEEILIPAADIVVLSGGEPFFSEVGVKLIRHIIEKYPRKKLYVFTNGVFLDAFGLETIMAHNFLLRVSLPGMSELSYMQVTGTRNYGRVRANIESLLRSGFQGMELTFVLSKESFREIDDFCRFVELNPGIRHALVEPNYFESRRFHRHMSEYEKRYGHLSARIDFDYRNKDLSGRVLRALYNPLHTIAFRSWSLREEKGTG